MNAYFQADFIRPSAERGAQRAQFNFNVLVKAFDFAGAGAAPVGIASEGR